MKVDPGSSDVDGSPRRVPIVFLILAFVTALFVWWEWKQGAYFGQVFYPGAIGIFCLFALLLANLPLGIRVAGPFRWALAGIVGLGAWTASSLLWTDVPSASIAYAERIAVYAVLFVVGAWAAKALCSRMHLALVPVAITAVVVGVATTVVLATGTDVSWYLQGDATLRFPIGYRNADVAFFLICLWPLIGLATLNWLHWAWRALAIAASTMLIDLAIIGQSRGSLPALIAALVVYMLVSPHRLRAVTVIALAVLPVLPALSDLLAVFRYGSPDAGAIPLLHTAARATAYTSLLSLALASVVLALAYPRLHLGPPRVRALSWVVGVVVVVMVVGTGLVFVGRHGGPIRFIDQRASEFGRVGYPNLHGQGVRFGANIGSNRHDFWRVAVDEGLEHPLLGGGAGSFQLAYLHHRRSLESPHDPHSIEAAVFSELGFPGFLLLALFIGGGVWAAVRSRRVGPVAASLTAAAAAGATQWFVHGSFDWFWQYAGVSGLGVYLLGVAAGPGLEAAGPERKAVGARVGAGVALVALALVAVPLAISSSYESRAIGKERGDPRASIEDLEHAADFNPLDDEPLITRGLIELANGARGAAAQSFREASDREPDNYAPYFFLARALLPTRRREALAALAEAERLNPREPAILALRRQLGGSRPR